MENRCIFCDTIIPEGSQLCPRCEYKLKNRMKKKDNDAILSEIIFLVCLIVISLALFYMRG